jgi:hypothetical protein
MTMPADPDYPFENLTHAVLGRVPGARRSAWTEGPVVYADVWDADGTYLGALWGSVDGSAGWLGPEDQPLASDVWHQRLAMAHAAAPDGSVFDGVGFVQAWLASAESGMALTVQGPHDAVNPAALLDHVATLHDKPPTGV